MASSSLILTESHEVSISQPSEFIWLLSQCARICERTYLSLTYSGLVIGGNDRHGLLAVSARIPQTVLPRNSRKKHYTLLFDSRRLLGASRLMYGASDLRMRLGDRRIDFVSAKGGEITYSVLGMEFGLHGFSKARYANTTKVPREAILTLCKAGAMYSDEVELKVGRNCLQLFGPETFETPIVSIRGLDFEPNGSAETVIPGTHLRRISELIKKSRAEQVALSFEKGKPFLLRFRFSDNAQVRVILGQSKDSRIKSEREKSPPDFESCPIVELVMFAGVKATGIDLTALRSAGLDTSSSLNILQGKSLDLVVEREGLVYLTRSGKIFLRLLRVDSPKAKQFLHESALGKIPSYGLIAKRLSQSPASLEELVREIKATSLRPEPLTVEYVASLIGILTWCGHATRKLSLLYSLAS